MDKNLYKALQEIEKQGVTHRLKGESDSDYKEFDDFVSKVRELTRRGYVDFEETEGKVRKNSRNNKSEYLAIKCKPTYLGKNALSYGSYEEFIKHNAAGKENINSNISSNSKQLSFDPIFRYRDSYIEEDLVFILMPFQEPWSDRVWKKMIKPIVEKEGLKAVRADDLYGHDIMEDIWKSILRARVIIADITGRNPNVFYEIGIAHTVGKDVILLTQDKNDIPFDLQRYRYILYEDNVDGDEKLKKRLKTFLQEIVPNAQISESINIPDLTKEAKELLLEATLDGTIMINNTLEGFSV